MNDHSLASKQLYVLKSLRAQIDKLEKEKNEPIAIVGMGCRFPGLAHDPQSFWNLLTHGKHGMIPIPPSRWKWEDFYDPQGNTLGKTYIKSGGFLQEDITQFDAPFFKISPKEAIHMDPQQRLLLEVVWESLENSGYDPQKLSNTNTGVFVGMMNSDYSKMHASPDRFDEQNLYVASGCSSSVAAGRISYLFGFTGPAITLDTACSSSLVAIHQACTHLRLGECDMAVAGGVNLILTPYGTLSLSKANALSREGFCKAFDESADGYIQSEGCGIVVLKKLSRAQRDKDPILAVIRGSAVNQDGASSGLTVPNGSAQEAVIRRALQQAGLNPNDIDCIEAHGTGTKLGDPIEIGALEKVFSHDRPQDKPLFIGSVKTNVGHTEAAAGMAGVMKIILSLVHETIPPHLHLKKLNPLISLEAIPARIPTENTPWKRGHKKRIAGVSSFGFSGTNAHVILEEAPESTPLSECVERTSHILTLSAQDPVAHKELVQKFLVYLNDTKDSLADISYTTNCARSHFDCRLAIAFETKEQLIKRLDPAGKIERDDKTALRDDRIAFLFTGQGSQYPHMTKVLYQTSPTFQNAMDSCAAILNSYLDIPLIELLYSGEDNVTSQINQTRYTQPALFAVEYSLCELWKSYGIKPSVVLGHSVGECVAATVAGVLSLEDGLKLISHRAQLMQMLCEPGAMGSIFADEETVRNALKNETHFLSIAAVNGPQNTVISGDPNSVKKILNSFEEKDVQTRQLHVSHAFHSHLMDPMLQEFEKVLKTISFSEPHTPLISNLTGDRVEFHEIAHSDYWLKHVRNPVQFHKGFQTCLKLGYQTFVEVGTQPVLTSLARECVENEKNFLWLYSLKKDGFDWKHMCENIARAYTHGIQIDWNGFHADYPRKKCSLPNYPFQRKIYWIDLKETVHSHQKICEHSVSLNSMDYLKDHVVFGQHVIPASLYIEMALSAVCNGNLHKNVILKDISFQKALVAENNQTQHVQCVLENNHFQISTSNEDVHACGKIISNHGIFENRTLDFEALQNSAKIVKEFPDCYSHTDKDGIYYGESFQSIEKVWASDHEVLAKIKYSAHFPIVLDCCFQSVAHVLGIEKNNDDVYLPVGVDQLHVKENLPQDSQWVWAHVRLSPESLTGSQIIKADIGIFDQNGHQTAQLSGFTVKNVPKELLLKKTESHLEDWLYEKKWILKNTETQADSNPTCDPNEIQILFSGKSPVSQHIQKQYPNAFLIEPKDLENNDQYILTLNHILQKNSGKNIKLIHLWSFEQEFSHELSCDALKLDQKITYLSGLLLLKTLAKKEHQNKFQLYFVSPISTSREGLSSSSLWGLARVAALEQPDLFCKCIGFNAAESSPSMLISEIHSHMYDEREVVLQGHDRLVSRLAKKKNVTPFHFNEPFELVCSQKGSIDNLSFAKKARRKPAADEVEIEIAATGLNFRDVMDVLGVYPGDAKFLGNECAGTIVSVGKEVTGLKPGDRVFALAGASFSSHVTVPALFVAPLPHHLSFEDGATLPVVFLTSYCALVHLGQLKAGEKVLIHAGAGGIGLSAIQIAQNKGAEIFATVGSEEKKQFLEKLGVKHIFNSRSLHFAEEILNITHGDGVDVVVNSLAGEFIPKSLSLLKKGGRFLEIGKTGIWSEATVRDQFPHVDYFTIALDALRVENPQFVRSMFLELCEQFQNKTLKPLVHEDFSLSHIQAAFRTMAAGKHIGKIVITHAYHKSVLITGGLGALGLATAKQLSKQHKVPHIILLGRASPQKNQLDDIKYMESLGTKVSVYSIDVSQSNKLSDLFSLIEEDKKIPPLGGVIHAAGATDDALLSEQNWEKYQHVFAPKVLGAWNVHVLSQKLKVPLDFFICFSSAASLLGNAGQANYAAANSFVDNLMRMRQEMGLAGLSVNWGAWSDIGLASKLDKSLQTKTGLGFLSPAQGLEIFSSVALHQKNNQLGVLPIDWNIFSKQFAPGKIPTFFEECIQAQDSYETLDFLTQLQETPTQNRKTFLVSFLQNELAQILGSDPNQKVDTRKGFNDLGFDSLMSVELRNRLRKNLGESYKLSTTLIFDHPNVEALADHLLSLTSDIPVTKEQKGTQQNVPFQNEPIAIVGMSCRFPGGSTNLDRYWELLEQGRDGIIEVPKGRGNVEDLYEANSNLPGKMYVKCGGFLQEPIDAFDADLFHISPVEAKFMDPQHRILLESTYEALENAGIDTQKLIGSDTGVFVGISYMDYSTFQADAQSIQEGGLYVGTGVGLSYASGRISYAFGFQGPSVSVDTACSSSLVAIHQACQSLRSSECSLAIAGGVSLLLTPQSTLILSQARALSPDGRCKAFDDSADGFARGEGCGVLVLKKLSQAQADGNKIYAVIRGSAINQDGASSGLTVPNGKAQEVLIKRALSNAGVEPSDVDYIEAHGTGTKLGDPIEFAALQEVFSKERNATDPLVIGSVKTNFGHLEPAAGVAGIIKVVLSLMHEKIPPQLHFKKLNAHIASHGTSENIQVATKLLPWKKKTKKRIAGVSGFAIQGSNAHIVLEESPEQNAVLTLKNETPYAFNRKRYWSGVPCNELDPMATGKNHVAPEALLWDQCIGKSDKEKRSLITSFLQTELAAVLNQDADTFDPDENFLTFGADSLMAVVIKNRLQKGFGDHIKIPSMIVFDHPSINELVDFLLEKF